MTISSAPQRAARPVDDLKADWPSGRPPSGKPQRGLEDEPPRGRAGGKARTAADEPPPNRPRKPSKAARVFLVFGIVWLVAGVSMLGWVLWEMYGTNIGVRGDYERQTAELEEMWAQPEPSVAPPVEEDPEPTEPTDDPPPRAPLTLANSNAFALMRIPKLGLTVPIQKGTDNYSLSRGVGWEPFTAGPGQLGNFVVAGHHSSHGQPFDRLHDLNAGDEYTVETREATYTYRLLNSPRDVTVDYRETWVMLPDPFEKSSAATRYLGTLLTCKEIFSTPLRSIGFAELIDTQLK
ncbi:MAG: sortase [Propionibacteriaceae bacterium]|jgi:sortase A|nr:sortase [Propionibacteriaceae bacterium]